MIVLVIIIVILLSIILVLKVEPWLKDKLIKRHLINVNFKFGDLQVKNSLGFIDETRDRLVVRIGSVVAINRDDSVMVFTPSLNRVVRVIKRDNNYFYNGED
jgi:hypothetical protein